MAHAHPPPPSSPPGLLDLPGARVHALIGQHLDADTRRAVMRASQRCCGLALGAASSRGLTLQVLAAQTHLANGI